VENVFMEFMDNRRRHCGVSMNNERCRVMLSATTLRDIKFMYDLFSLLPSRFGMSFIEIYGKNMRPKLENLMAHKKRKEFLHSK
jgi:hypothetical protein